MKININKEMDESHRSLEELVRRKRDGEDVFKGTGKNYAKEFIKACDDLLRESGE